MKEKWLVFVQGEIMSLRDKLERVMLAITFAEAGEHETARRFIRDRKRKRTRKTLRKRPRLQLRAPRF